jgi:capsid assembly protease
MRRMKLLRLITAFAATPWAMMPDRLEAAIAVLNARAGENNADLSALVAPVAARPTAQPAGNSPGVVAVIPVWGVISHRAHMVDDMCGPGGTSTEKLQSAIRSAVADPNVKAIVLDIDSPGGSVFGVQELADDILAARDIKPILANANSLAASAAYWLGTAASELHVTPSGEVGSVGVYAAHVDVSKSQELKGLKTTLISAGKFKIEGNPYQPLDPEAAAQIQARVNDYYDGFVKAVAKHRGVGVQAVRDGFGQGRTVGAKDAVTAGMADQVATLDQTIQRAMKLARQTERSATAGNSRALADARIRIARAA